MDVNDSYGWLALKIPDRLTAHGVGSLIDVNLPKSTLTAFQKNASTAFLASKGETWPLMPCAACPY